MPASKPESLYNRIYRTVRRIPRGRVATYGQVARESGLPRHARLVGYALHALGDESVPWHRVINAQGRISLGCRHGADDLQMRLLLQEGVEFRPDGRCDLRLFLWRPRAARSAAREKDRPRRP